jgi:putative ABC transport system ATP-binding protein
MADIMATVDDVHRSYGRRATAVHAVAGVTLGVATGEALALVGPSGCGKSTLLHMIGGLDRPDRGTVTVAGTQWHSLRGRKLAERRRQTCGFVFQNLVLLPAATAWENIEIPLVLAGVPRNQRRDRVAELLDQVGLGDVGNHLPDQLSGGQQQRVGIARALVHSPRLVLADEPTGSLDSVAAQGVATLLVDVARRSGATVVLVTHDPAVAAHADRVLRMHSGLLAGGGTNGTIAGDPARADRAVTR